MWIDLIKYGIHTGEFDGVIDSVGNDNMNLMMGEDVIMRDDY